MKNILFYPILVSVCLSIEKDYFQQHVAYDIEVTLDDSAHTLDAYEKIVYTNNSPDTLDFIWFHLWPNAYKNTETAFAKQKERFLNNSFIFSKEKKRGYIDSLNFIVDGLEAEWEYHDEWIDVAKIQLPKSLPPSGKINIETPFFVKLPKVFSRLGNTGKHYEITQWYPKPAVYDHQGWHPMPYLDMGEFYSEFGSYDVKITLPAQYRIMATGDLVNGEIEYAWLDSLAAVGDSLHALDKKTFKKAIKELKKSADKKKEEKSFLMKLIYKFIKEKKGKEIPVYKTLHFHQDNVHDFAWFADPKWIVRKGALFLKDSTHEVTLWSMYYPKNAKMWENSIEYLHDSGYWYSMFNGDYPYNHITAVDGDLSAGGGMEYPNITVISKMGSKHLLEMVIMHEVGHNWFYGILGSNERDHTWMDEGLNEFCNIRYWDKKYGDENRKWIINEFTQEKLGPFSIGKNIQFGFFEYMGYTSWVKRGDEEPLETSSNDFRQRTNYWLSYSKPLVYTWHLLDYLGEEAIDSIFHNYYIDWKFKHPYPDDYFSYVRRYSDKDLSWYTHDVFYETGRVDYAASIQGDEVIFKNYGTLTLPFESAFYDKKGNEISRHWYENVKRIHRESLPEGAKSVKIDPDQTLPDGNRANNSTSKPFTLTWVFDQPQYDKQEIFWMPWIFSGNQYNGWTPGFNFYHGFVPGYDYGIGLRPMWDFKNNKLIGSISFANTIYGLGNFYTNKISFDAGRNAGRTGFHIEIEGKQKEHLERYPIWTTIFNVDYHNIVKGAVDTVYYYSGETAVGYAELKFHNRPNPFLNYYFRTGLKTGIQNSQFLRIHMQTNIYYQFTKECKAKLRIWVGGFLDKSDLPQQYLTYLSGNIDPDFRNGYIINRTSDINDASVGIYQYDIGGPSLHGLILENDKIKGVNNWVISTNFDMSVPKLPAKLFMDFAMIEGDVIYFDLGLKKSFGPLMIIFPLYQSWDVPSMINDKNWLLHRIRFSLAVPSFNVRNMF
jgi:hypothetical protein